MREFLIALLVALVLAILPTPPARAARLTILPNCPDYFMRQPKGTLDIEFRCRSTPDAPAWLTVKSCPNAKATRDVQGNLTLTCNGQESVKVQQ